MSPLPSIPAAPPVRAVFLDIGQTVIRPEPSWEGIYATAFAAQVVFFALAIYGATLDRRERVVVNASRVNREAA